MLDSIEVIGRSFRFAFSYFSLVGITVLPFHSQAEILTEADVAKRALIWVDSKTWKDSTLAESKLACDVISRYETLIYVQCFKAEGPKLITALSKLKGIRDVFSDKIVAPLQHSLPSRPYLPLNRDSSGTDSRGRCRISETCADGRAKFWAQERMDADLMFQELGTNIRLEKGHTKVAVIDTGFDMTAARSQMDESLLSVAPGWDGAGDPKRDEVGHGTPVAGLIGGTGGVGLAPDARLTVYRVSRANPPDNKSTTSVLQMAVMKACNEGNEVINLSWGTEDDEAGTTAEENSYRAFYAELAAKGCLVVKSAGNSARRISRPHLDADDALLRVEASAPAGTLASFSSNGEISAPGEGVFTLRSNQSNTSAADPSCGGTRHTFINGTSFAAPLTSAVATQVLGILKRNEKFTAMTGPRRVASLNRVLLASTTKDGLNALRAVKIADMVSQDDSAFPAADSESIERRFQQTQQAYCQQRATPCMQELVCKNQQSCALNSRKHIALCEPPNSDIVQDLFHFLDKAESNEASLSLIKHGTVFTPQQQEHNHRRFWDRLHRQWSQGGLDPSNRMSFDQALQLLPTLAASRTQRNLPSDSTRALKDFLTSRELRNRLNRDSLAESNADLTSVVSLLKTSFDTLSRPDFLKLMSETLESAIKKRPYTTGEGLHAGAVASMARILDAMIDDPRFEAIKEKLIAFERTLAVKASATMLGDSSISNSKHFKGLYSRNADLLAAQLDIALSSRGHVNVQTLAMQYLSTTPDQIPDATKRSAFNLKLMASYQDSTKSTDMAIGGLASRTATSAHRNLVQIFKEATPEEQAKLRDNYWKASDNSHNIRIIASSLLEVKTPITQYSYTHLQSDPYLKGEKIHERSEKLAALARDQEQWNLLSSAKLSTIQKVLPLLAIKPASTNLVSPLANDIVKAALQKSSATDWNDFKKITLGHDTETIRYIISESSTKDLLKNSPEFMDSLRKLSGDIGAQSARYGSSATSLKSAIDAFLAP